MKLAERPCPSCKEAHVLRRGRRDVLLVPARPGAVRARARRSPASSRASSTTRSRDRNRKLRVDKMIEGRTTYLRLAGDLDGTFPREKLAEGLEGTVIVDLGAVGAIEPAGAAEWRGFVQMVDAARRAALPRRACRRRSSRSCARSDDLGAKAQVLTLHAAVRVQRRAGRRARQTIDVGAALRRAQVRDRARAALPAVQARDAVRRGRDADDAAAGRCRGRRRAPTLVKSIGDPARARAAGRSRERPAAEAPRRSRCRARRRAARVAGSCRSSRRCSRSCSPRAATSRTSGSPASDAPAGARRGHEPQRRRRGRRGSRATRRAPRRARDTPTRALSCVGVSSLVGAPGRRRGRGGGRRARGGRERARGPDHRRDVEAARCRRSTRRRATPSSPRSIAIRAAPARGATCARRATRWRSALRATGGAAVPAGADRPLLGGVRRAPTASATSRSRRSRSARPSWRSSSRRTRAGRDRARRDRRRRCSRSSAGATRRSSAARSSSALAQRPAPGARARRAVRRARRSTAATSPMPPAFAKLAADEHAAARRARRHAAPQGPDRRSGAARVRDARSSRGPPEQAGHPARRAPAAGRWPRAGRRRRQRLGPLRRRQGERARRPDAVTAARGAVRGRVTCA